MSSQLVDLTDENDIEIMSVEDYVPKKGKCCNVDCKNTTDLLFTASDSVKRFYGVEAYYKRRKVCQLCFQNYRVEKSKIVQLVKSGTNVFSPEITLSRKTFIIPEESDSDDSSFDDSSDDSECEFDLLQLKGITSDANNSRVSTRSSVVRDDDIEELQEVALDLIQRNNLLEQIGEGSIIIQKRLEDAQAGFDRYTEEFNLIEKKIDNVRDDFYSIFEETVVNLPPLEIGPPECLTQKPITNLQPVRSVSSDVVSYIQTSSPIKQASASIVVPPNFFMQKNVLEGPQASKVSFFEKTTVDNRQSPVDNRQASSDSRREPTSEIIEIPVPSLTYTSPSKNIIPNFVNKPNNLNVLVNNLTPTGRIQGVQNSNTSGNVSSQLISVGSRQSFLDNRRTSSEISEIRQISVPSSPYASPSKNITPNFLNRPNNPNLLVNNHTSVNRIQTIQNTNNLGNVSSQLINIPEGVNLHPLSEIREIPYFPSLHSSSSNLNNVNNFNVLVNNYAPVNREQTIQNTNNLGNVPSQLINVPEVVNIPPLSQIREIPVPSLHSSSSNLKNVNNPNVLVNDQTPVNRTQAIQNTNTPGNISSQSINIPEKVTHPPLLEDSSTTISCPDSLHDEFSSPANLETQTSHTSFQNLQDKIHYSASELTTATATESLDVSGGKTSFVKRSSPRKLDESGIMIVDTKHSDAFNNLPPNGPLIRSQIKAGDKVYVTKSSNLSKWVEAKITNINTSSAENLYDVQFVTDCSNQLAMKTVSAKHLAYFSECQVKVPFKTRIIALVEDSQSSECFYVGIIGEIPTAANKYRYLVFFDDGYVQYVKHSDIRIVVRDTVNVWEDVDEKSQEFIKKYLETYPEKPMVRLQKYSFVQTELCGRWHRAQVSELDCSLVKIFFPVQMKYEWIYRGSSRFKVLFEMKLKFNLKMESDTPNLTIRRRTLPINKKAPTVEYINLEPSDTFVYSKSPVNVNKQKQELILETKGRENILSCDTLENKNFIPHKCNKYCIKNINKNLDFKVCSPLLKPILCGWKRQFSKVVKKTVTRIICVYVAPCGRRLRSYEEISNYLNLTTSSFTLDMFTLDSEVNLFRTWEPDSVNFYSKDITDNQEEVYISAVNSINSLPPKKLQYCGKRIMSDNVSVNLDPNFLVCCDCKDSCMNKLECKCWALTIEAERAVSNTKRVNENIGYNYKRLYEQLRSGIFECNSNCSCQKSCLNRVVQFPIKQRLQLFKTAQRGWGVRTLNDIPKGNFICTYVGKIITDAQANEEGAVDGGDEYYADLDYIRNMERMKEGYESYVSDIEDEEGEHSDPATEEEKSADSEDDNKKRRRRKSLYEIDEDFTLKSDLKTITKRNRSSRIQHRRNTPVKEDENFKLNADQKKTTLRNKSSRIQQRLNTPVQQNQHSLNTPLQEDGEDSDDSSKREPKNFEPEELEDSELLSKLTSNKSHIACYNEQYVVDSKVIGNIGRYFNHSCDPNIFCQNVFVDTHDLRFPWVSFFSMENITAGTELTWDYSYEVGSIPNRYKKCYCRSKNCKGRFL